MISMTGFGKAQFKFGPAWLKVEVSSVNRRQLEVLVSLPKEWSRLERLVRDWVTDFAKRGRVQVFVEFAGAETYLKGSINSELASYYGKLFQNLAQKLKLENGITLRDILSAPGVLMERSSEQTELVESYLEKTVKKALQTWKHSRELEGNHLKKDFLWRLKKLRLLHNKIKQRADQVPKLYREKLKSRLEQSGLTLSWEDEGLRKELLFFADRSDITEELTRLESHFIQVESSLRAKEEAGRKLEFLLQEIFREVNTIGSKANDIEITKNVVELKMEIEKMREQVQNVE